MTATMLDPAHLARMRRSREMVRRLRCLAVADPFKPWMRAVRLPSALPPVVLVKKTDRPIPGAGKRRRRERARLVEEGAL